MEVSDKGDMLTPDEIARIDVLRSKYPFSFSETAEFLTVLIQERDVKMEVKKYIQTDATTLHRVLSILAMLLPEYDVKRNKFVTPEDFNGRLQEKLGFLLLKRFKATLRKTQRR